MISAQPMASRSVGEWLAQHWFFTFAMIYGLWVWLPFLAPLLMHIGWNEAGRGLYFFIPFFAISCRSALSSDWQHADAFAGRDT